MMSMTENTTLLATFGAGCFWGVEETFLQTPGVTGTAVGFMGGTLKDPTYEDVCYRDTNHAEVVQVQFDPALVTYQKLLEIFFENHDPTTFNRQGPDVGSQYRSVVFTHAPEQVEAAQAKIAELNTAKRFPRPIVTKVEPATEFYKAEDYHQQYLRKRGLNSCHI
jgi:peptide-methionine (S)-S-oxide reductase